MLRVFCSALSPLLLDLFLLEPPPLFEELPEDELPEDGLVVVEDLDLAAEDVPLPPPLVVDPEPPLLLPAPEDEPEELSAGVVTAGVAPLPGVAVAGVATEITCAGVVVVLPAPARPISTPTPIASSSTPTPATAVAPEERQPPAAPPPTPPLDGAGPETVAGVKRLRNWLRACTWRPPHSRQ
jgi:hypothetical protein